MRFVTRAALYVAPVLFLAATVNRSGAPSHATGAPGESTCTACHTGNPLNSPEGSVTITAPDVYTPGEVIQVGVRVNRSAASRFGFELTAKNTAGQFVGAFDVSAPGIAFALGSPNEHVTHAPAVDTDGSMSWTVPWTAPAAGSGTVTLYAAGNGANGDFTNQGDFIFTTSLVMSEGSATDVETGSELPYSLEIGAAYPNPALAQSVTIPFASPSSSPVSLTLSDISGRAVDARIARFSDRFTIGTTGLVPGVYIARLSDGRAVRSVRFTVLP